MAQEIERKFLVKGDGWKKLTLLKKVEIEQGYLSKSRNMTVRIRVTDTTAFITIKGKRVDLTCDEFEYEIPHADGVALIAQSVTSLVRKTRSYVRDDKGQVWDIDVFKGINRGLTMAEFEMTSTKQVVHLPPWISTEVSHDKRYVNTYLAEHKVPRTL
jgi:CYTH domain-containing protein